MEILYQQLSKDSEYCISLLDVQLPYFVVPWHYHPELEIIFIEKSDGLRFVGDHSEPFAEGDIALIGPNLPHVWRSDARYHNRSSGLQAHALVVHFKESVLGGDLGKLPEMKGINKLLFDSKRGITFYGKTQKHLAKKIKALNKSTGLTKITGLLEILDFMGNSSERKLLASVGYSKIRSSADFDRFDKVHRYMIEHFQENISLTDVAKIAGMSPTSFCRYFKKRTTKPFLTFLNEMRIGHACKLIMEQKMSIAGVAYECGFNNISNFNLRFKQAKGAAPGQYLKSLLH